MNIESKYLEDRLICHENTFGAPSVSNLALKFADFVKDLQENKDQTSSLDHLAREIMLYLFDASNAEKANYGSDVAEYQTLEENIEKQINSNQKAILLLTEELSQQQKIRKHKEECEALAKAVNTYQSRRVLNAEIEKVNEYLRKLNDKLNSTENRISLRSKQFQLLLRSIYDLQAALHEDEELDKLTSQYENMENEEDILGTGDDADIDDAEREEDRSRSRGGDERDAKKPRLDDGEGEEGGEVVAEGEVEGIEGVEDKVVGEDGVVEDGEVEEEPGEVSEVNLSEADPPIITTV